MSMLKEFKTFAMRGNVVDMAVGIIIGGAFGKIVASLVNDVVMPPIGLLIGGVDFATGRLSCSSLVATFGTVKRTSCIPRSRISPESSFSSSR